MDGLLQKRHNSSALALELCLFCTNPLVILISFLQQSDDEDDDTPPPIPDVPPPLPNWDTFPSDAPITDLSFLDSSDLLPDSNAQTPAREEEGDVLNSKIEVLRRRSQFLGIRLEELDEYKKLLAGRFTLVFAIGLVFHLKYVLGYRTSPLYHANFIMWLCNNI